MAKLVFSSLLFLVTHLGISSSAMRPALVRRLGNTAYLALYSVISLVTFAYMIIAYNAHPVSDYLWVPSGPLRVFAYVVVAIAFVFLIGGFATRNPTAIGQADSMAQPPRGMICVTRHPFQWSVVLWSVAHIAANGDLASIVFFGTFGVLSLSGTFLIDAKKATGEHWATFSAATSNVPFAAVFSGRARLSVSQLWLPAVVGLAVYALVFWGHRWVAGVTLL